jgi:hypothetical protein
MVLAGGWENLEESAEMKLNAVQGGREEHQREEIDMRRRAKGNSDELTCFAFETPLKASRYFNLPLRTSEELPP